MQMYARYNAWQVAQLYGLHPSTNYTSAELAGLTEYSAAQEIRSPRAMTPRIPAHVIFLDGHSSSPMDEGWRSLFLSVNYAMHLRDKGV